MLAAIHDRFGDRVLLGAGTVLDIESADQALQAGARFIVSPHTDVALVERLAQRGVPTIPGAFTATEVLTAWRAGATIVKVFPVGSVGPAYIKDLRGPLGNIPLLPTGGVTEDNAAEFVRTGAWGLAVGSALVDPRLVEAEAWDELARRATRFSHASLTALQD
jgi:2-dehydro-3-deoxyphosphogluconate aldolase / (4S)-4-hydroxy-2-oxoglutarate aldolase